MSIEVESGIPMPEKTHTPRKGRSPKYPFRTMKPGQSFTCTDAERTAVYAAARYQLGESGRITVREIGPDLHRVWLKPEEA